MENKDNEKLSLSALKGALSKKDLPDKAKVKFSLSDDKLKCFLTIYASKSKISEKQLLKLLNNKGIKVGIKKDKLKELAEKYNTEKVDIENELVAEGTPLKQGRAASLNVFNENFDVVEEGETIAEKILPSEFEPGEDVFGNIIKGENVTDLEINVGENVGILEEQNKILYIAACSGGFYMADKNSIEIKETQDGRYTIEESDDGFKIYANLVPPQGSGKEIDFNEVSEKVKEVAGERKFYAEELEKAIKKVNEEKELETVLVAETVDKEIQYSVDVEEDGMIAYISVTVPAGFKGTIDIDAIKKVLEQNNITAGFSDDEIRDLIEEVNNNKQSIEKFPIAKGKEPIKGENATVSFSVEFGKEQLVKDYNELGKIVYRKLRVSEEVNPEQLLAYKMAAIPKEDGYKVTGEVIEGEEPEDKLLIAGAEVRTEDEEGKISYYSKIKGKAIYNENDFTISVEPSVEAEITVFVSEDNMQAKIQISPPVGVAKDLTLEEVKKAIEKEKIKLKDEYIEKIKKILPTVNVKKSSVVDLLVAEGEEPQDGEDGKVVYKVNPEREMQGLSLQEGKADFKTVMSLNNVMKDQVLGVIKKPVEGKKNGYDVYGKEIPAKKGKKAEITVGENVYINKNDEICASIDGEFTLDANNNPTVIDILTLEEVTMEVGNVEYNGKIQINGNVNEGFTIKAKGDIVVAGFVSGSKLISDGKIMVKEGIINSQVHSEDEIFAEFIETSDVESNDKIFVEDSIIKSKVASRDSIMIKKSKKGTIIGDYIIALNHIEADYIGSKHGAKMEIILGQDYVTEKKLKEIEYEMRQAKHNKKEIDNQLNMLTKTYSSPEKLTPKINDQMESLKDEQQKMSLTIENLNQTKEKLIQRKKQQKNEDSSITVRETMYTDVSITIGNIRIYTKNEIDKSVIKKNKEDKIISVPIKN